MENSNIDNIFNLQIEQDAHQELKGAAYWGRIIAIVNFVAIGLSLLQVILIGSKAGSIGLVTSFMMVAISGVINFFLYMFLYRFGKHSTEGLGSTNQGELNTGINGLRNFFKMAGILLIIGLALILIVFLFALAGAAFLGNR